VGDAGEPFHRGSAFTLGSTRSLDAVIADVGVAARLLLADVGGDKPSTDKRFTPLAGTTPPLHTLVRESA